jgi:hypothetical protein
MEIGEDGGMNLEWMEEETERKTLSDLPDQADYLPPAANQQFGPTTESKRSSLDTYSTMNHYTITCPSR